MDILSTVVNCKNCGAPIGDLAVCQYCGTHNYGKANLDFKKASELTLNIDGRMVQMKVIVKEATLEQRPAGTLYADDYKFVTYGRFPTTLKIECELLPFRYDGYDSEVLYAVRKFADISRSYVKE